MQIIDSSPRMLAAAALLLAGLVNIQAQDDDVQMDTIRVETEAVRVPVVVIDEENDRLLTDLQADNFMIYEDGVRQQIDSFSGGKAEPLTIVLLLEHSENVKYLMREVYRPAGVFVSQMMGLKDYAALIAFDRRPRILSDFTRNEQQLLDAVNQIVRSPTGFGEGSLFDAIRFVVAGGTQDHVEYKGLDEVEGRTGLLVVATGIDGFSHITYDDVRRDVARAGVPVYSIGVGELAYLRAEPYLNGLQRLTFLQAQNNLRHISEVSGGRFYSLRFEGALNDVLESIANMLRYQYTLSYLPSNPIKPSDEPQQRKIEVRVDVDGDGEADQDGIELQYRRKYWTGG